jgi:hypothetical protein
MESAAERIWRDLSGQWEELRRVLSFWGPLTPVPAWMAPPVAIGALLGLILLSGVALVSMGVLLTALLTAHLLLEQVLGVSVTAAPLR